MTEEQKFRLAAKACGKDLTGWKWCDNDQRFEFVGSTKTRRWSGWRWPRSAY